MKEANDPTAETQSYTKEYLNSKVGKFYKFNQNRLSFIKYNYPSSLMRVIDGTAKYALLEEVYKYFNIYHIMISHLLDKNYAPTYESTEQDPHRDFDPIILDFEDELPDDIQAMLTLAYIL